MCGFWETLSYWRLEGGDERNQMESFGLKFQVGELCLSEIKICLKDSLIDV
jgi:hypothetical protein